MSRLRCRAFSLLELLVVMVVILILIAILMPALRAVRWAAYNRNTSHQMDVIYQASAVYSVNYNSWPGWFEDRPLAANPTSFTQNESMVLSLMGLIDRGAGYWPAGHANPDGLMIDLTRIGRGPVSRPGQPNAMPRDAYLQVGDEQWHAIQGTTGGQNMTPELIDVSTGLPMLIFRSRVGADGSVLVDAATDGGFLLDTNADYFNATALQDVGGDIHDQASESLLSVATAGSAQRAAENASYLLYDRLRMRRGVVIVAPGQDHRYFSKEKNSNVDSTQVTGFDDMKSNDDVVRRFGQP
jgi:prepilin-type N-terminal cleavage/methylation domain-containing protein